MSERKPLVLLDGAVRQLPQGDTIAGGTDAELTARFDTYRTVAANGTGFPKGAGILDFAANGTLVVLSPDGSPIEAYYNGGYMPLPSGVSHQFTNAFSGYVVALPGEDALTAIVSPPNLNHRIVAWVGYNPDSPDPWWYAGFEMHTPARNPDAHLLHHLETGMTWLSGGELTRQDESDPQNARFALTNVSVADEDLHFTIENDTAQDSYTTHLLRFDGEANDAVTGAIWYKNNAVAFQPSGRAEFGQCAAWTAGVSVWFSRAAPALRRSDFTLEAWVNIESVSPGYNGTNAAPLFSFLNGNNWNGQALVLWYRRYEDFNNLTLAFYPRSSSAQLLTGTSDLVGAGWTHVALTRQADVWRIWVNGVKEAEATFAFDITVSNYRWYVGGTPLGYGQYPWTGQMDEVRISLGLARYSQNFTPPDKPFSLKPLAQGEFLQELSPTLHAPILYIDGFGRWAATPGNQTAPPAMYNAVSESGIGSFVAVPDGQYLTYWLCFTTCKRYPVKWIMGRRAHAYVELAQEENFKRLGLPTPEIVAAYRVVFRADATAPDALVVVEAKRIGRASQIDDYALTGQPERTAGDDWSLYSLRRTMWPEQVHTDATGVWVKLGGDITGFEEAYPLDLFPSLANVTAGDVVVTPNNMTAANAPLPYVVTQSSTVSASTYPGWKVFDGGTGQWRSNTSTFSVASGGDEWVQIDLGAAYGIGYLRFETPDEAHAPLRFQLWGSNNDAAVPTWYDGATLLAEVDSVYQLESLGTRIYGLAISNGSPFRFFRFRVQSLRTNTSTQCYLAEIKLLAAGLSLKNTEDAIGSFQFMKVAEAA